MKPQYALRIAVALLALSEFIVFGLSVGVPFKLADWLLFSPGTFFASAISLAYFRSQPLRALTFIALVAATSFGMVAGTLYVADVIPWHGRLSFTLSAAIAGGFGATVFVALLRVVFGYPKLDTRILSWYFFGGALSQLIAAGFASVFPTVFIGAFYATAWWFVISELFIRRELFMPLNQSLQLR